ncbi:FAD-dependent monooxygenase [Pelagibacterium montanilacus]|uniref:FAD binding domain-containing protein n=1 Tax=Pelagibacterium montanilacus TaxID=2185280 RepID=UPI0013DFC3F5|nr:FAD-dependent monooxygenase [Pelagibacterium montanilacus]
MKRHAVIVGGSIGGLFAARMLDKAGWQVTVLERSPVELSGRGAGIVTHDLLNELIADTGATIEDLGVKVEERVVYDHDGEIIYRRPLPQVVTSWDRVHSLLRALLPKDAYVLDMPVTGYREGPDGVEVLIEGKNPVKADVLIGADGFRSAIRAQMLPEIQPVYSGYVVWRALAQEKDLSEAVRREVFPHFGFYMPTGTQIVGYPIAGVGNDLRPGHRRYNFVWYLPVTDEELADMLTDDTGRRHDISIPPPLVRKDVARRSEELAHKLLPPPFGEILSRSSQPFFTPIYDHISPTFAQGRVALLGDAACVARPHVGMGVTKAAYEARILARKLSSIDDPVAALAAYSSDRQPEAELAMMIGRELGDMIYDDPEGGNPDGRNNPHLEHIAMETAVVPKRYAVDR